MFTGLNKLGEVFSALPDQQVVIRDEGGSYLWQVNACAGCRTGRGCQFFAGMLQEYMAWLGGGKVYLVDQITCCTEPNGICQFRLQGTPLD